MRFANQAGQHTALDVALFTQWAEAVSTDNDALRTFIADRFRAEFAPVVEAWVATDPLNNPDAPSSPFVMAEYRVAAADRAAELEQLADQRATAGRQASDISGNYVLTTVLFAVVLFFVGIGSKFSSLRVRVALLSFAGVALVAGVAILATFPIQL